jgi:hypothetical protein
MRNRNSGKSATKPARTMTATVLVAVLASLAAVSGRAQAQQRAPFGTVATAPAAPPLAPLGIVLAAGMRSDLVRSAGLDPFAGSDSISQGALGVGYRFGEVDDAGLAVGFEWNRGSLSAGARSAATDLTIDRLTLGIEGRYPIVRRLAVFVRLAPGLLRSQAHWYDLSAPAAPYDDGGTSALSQKKWSPAVDAGAGVAFRFGDLRSPGLPSVSLWLVADGGFGFSPGHDLTLRNQSQPLPGRTDEPIRLGNLSLSGGFARVRLAASF